MRRHVFLSRTSVTRQCRIDGLEPRVDSARQVVDILKAFAKQVLGIFAAANSMVAVQGDRRVPVEPEQVLSTCLMEGTRRRNASERSLVLRPDVKEPDLVPIEHGLELRRAQLLHLRRLVRVTDLEPAAGPID